MKLNQCPFCGGDAQVVDEHRWVSGRNNGYGRQYVQCVKCSCRTMPFDWDEKKDMIETWNRRTYEVHDPI